MRSRPNRDSRLSLRRPIGVAVCGQIRTVGLSATPRCDNTRTVVRRGGEPARAMAVEYMRPSVILQGLECGADVVAALFEQRQCLGATQQ